MSLPADDPAVKALEELGRLCAPYVGTLLANGDTERAVHLRTQLKAVSLELQDDDCSDPELRRQLDVANCQIAAFSKQVRELSHRLMACNGELRQEIARADRAEDALRAQLPHQRLDAQQ